MGRLDGKVAVITGATSGIEGPFSPAIASEAKQSIYPGATSGIASSLRSLAQTLRVCRRQ